MRRSAGFLAILLAALVVPRLSMAFPIAFDPPVPYINDYGVYDVQLSDIDLDGDLDAVFPTTDGQSVNVWRNNGAGIFNQIGSYPAGATTFTLVRDLNADGLPDLAIANFLLNTLQTRQNLGGGVFGPVVDNATGSGPRSVVAVDWNHDGDLELAVAEFNDSKVRILDRVGPGLTYSMIRLIDVAGTAKAVTTGDLDGDGWPEVIVSCHSTGTVTVLNSASPGPGERTDYFSGTGCSMVVVAHLNGDANLDLAVVNEAPSIVTFLGTGGGALGPPTVVSTPAAELPQAIVAADFDRDGDTDLVISSYGTSSIYTFVNQGNTGTFAELHVQNCGNTPRGLAAGDLDGDLDSDLVVSNYTPNYGNTGFVTMKNSSTRPMISSIVPGGGPAGTLVTIHGIQFTGVTAVTFRGFAAAFTVVSDVEIQATVPAGARSGPVVLASPGGTGESPNPFYVTPDIQSFVPGQAPIGTAITLRGLNFIGATDVKFNGVSATFSILNDSLITASVPLGATDGPIQVTGPGGSDTSDENFIVGPELGDGGHINLSWDDCGAFGPLLQTFDCDVNSGAFKLVASYVPPPAVDHFLGLSARLNLTSISGGIFPDWWRHGTGECRGTTAMSASFDFTAGPFNCTDWFSGQAVGGFLYINPEGASSTAQLLVQAAVPLEAQGAVDPAQEYYAFRIQIQRTRTVGTPACGRCDFPMAIELREIQLFQPLEYGFDPRVTLPGNGTTVYWQDNTPTPVLVTLVKSEAFADHNRLVWELPRGDAATLYRRESAGAWSRLASLVPDGTRRAEYIDRDVRVGATYSYRVGILVGGEEVLTGEVSLTVPAPVRALSLSRMAWTGRGVSASVSLPVSGTATLEIFDASGRRAFSQRMEGLKAGEQAVEFATRLAPGMYFGRLTYGEKSTGARLIVMN